MYKPLSARSSRPLRSADRCDLLVPCALVPYFSIPEPGICSCGSCALERYSSCTPECDATGNIICVPTLFEDFSFHQPVTLRAPLNSLLREALYKYPYNITWVFV